MRKPLEILRTVNTQRTGRTNVSFVVKIASHDARSSTFPLSQLTTLPVYVSASSGPGCEGYITHDPRTKYPYSDEEIVGEAASVAIRHPPQRAIPESIPFRNPRPSLAFSCCRLAHVKI